MAPPAPRAPAAAATSRKPLVLEEEEWAEALEAIIERDFFPDIPKLQSKLEWLQACARAPALPWLTRLLVWPGSTWHGSSAEDYLMLCAGHHYDASRTLDDARFLFA